MTSWVFWVFLLAPLIMGFVLFWRFPSCRVIRFKAVIFYLLIMTLLIWAALEFVAWVACAVVPPIEIFIVLWFAVGWRLAWELWNRTVGRLGQRRVRWARLRQRHQLGVPIAIRLIPLGRALLTAFIFFPLFLSTVITHRCKLTDGQDPYSVFKMDYESVHIPTADGIILDGWFIPDGQSDRTIVICHGAGANKGNFVWFLGPLARRGYNVVFFDFRAHGASEGRTTTYGIREKLDVIAVADWLKKQRPEQSRTIVGLGSSQGSMALALAAAEDERIDAVILDSPFLSPHELTMHHARRVPVLGPLMINIIMTAISVQTGTDFFNTSAEQAVAAIGDRPLLIIHGRDDFVMPAYGAQRLYEAAKGPRQIWFGPGPHSNIVTTTPDQYAKRVFGFLNSYSN